MDDEMFDNLGELFERAGRQVAKALPRGWKTAWCQVEMAEDHASMGCFYIGDGAPTPISIRPPHELTDTFREIWNESPEPPWTTATFILHSDGKFDIDYGYEPIPSDEMLQRREAWKKKYLPQ